MPQLVQLSLHPDHQPALCRMHQGSEDLSMEA